jgi:anaerobic selenocysteine-containing dehydrogenase
MQNGWVDRDFIAPSTTGYAEFAEFVRQFTPDKVAAETGLTVGEIYRFAESIHRGKAVSFWWTMGVNQSHESHAHRAGHHQSRLDDRQHW